ncbi:POZ domain-containing protein [Cystobasidium minutum MCA 4210]|uniref:POZ domain-containing protein n=1 Tax=Cystobasidium minutum MCA 4210 TaxID=1397322 RepID=UPI0034CFA1BE|eukprot:jgi/Rhomi1/197238/gm1.5452_g
MQTSTPSENTAGPAWIALISAEGHRIILPRSAAVGSKTIHSLLSDPDWEESKTGIVRLPTISTHILELIAEYLIYKEKYSSSDASANQRIPDFQSRIPIEYALETLEAADYLEEDAVVA